ncbi:MAG: rod shape-determining protein RodA [Candidatus Latescibacterota bacterium]
MPAKRIPRKTHGDLLLILLSLLLVASGIVAIYSAGHHSGSEHLGNSYIKQMIWAALAMALLLAAALMPYRIFYALAYVCYGGMLSLLVLVLIAGTNVGGAHRWFAAGPIHFQPSEWAKIATVILLARVLSDRKRTLEETGAFVLPFVLALLPMALVLREPDLGTALVFPVILFPMLYWAGARLATLFFILSPLLSLVCALLGILSNHYLPWGLFVALLLGIIFMTRPHLSSILVLSVTNLVVGIATPFFWGRLHTYQQNRILSFLNPEQDPLRTGYQLIQSKVAIGSGGFFGKGILEGTQTQLAFLPAQHTDFIFSVIGEELGFAGVSLILIAFMVLIWRGLVIATTVKSPFSSLIAVGLISILTFHVFVNVGMAVGLMPVTGLPLPFLSYGGSSLSLNMILIGILFNLSANRYEY